MPLPHDIAYSVAVDKVEIFAFGFSFHNEVMMTRAQANMLLLLAGVIWGMGFVAQSTAMASIGPFLFIGIRSAIAALTVLPWAIAEGRRTRTRLRAGNYIYFMIGRHALYRAHAPADRPYHHIRYQCRLSHRPFIVMVPVLA